MNLKIQKYFFTSSFFFSHEMRNYRRRIRRFVKRLTRSIFRPKRRYRNSRRRRIRKSRRYYRRRKSARVVRKKAVSTRSLIGGKLYRTYYFPVSISQLLKGDGTFSTSAYYVNWEPLRYNGMTIAELSADDTYEHLWTGAANCVTVTGIPEINARLLGFSQYTVIRLDWMGMFRLFALGDYTNQIACLKQDCGNYSYYKPISITIELIPKFARPSAKTTFRAPDSVTLPTLNLVNEQAGATLPGWTGAIADGTVVSIPASNKIRGASDASVHTSISHYYDEDAESHVGYIIPATTNTTSRVTEQPQNQLYQTSLQQMYTSFLASVAQVPNSDFVSSVRRAPYKRGRIVAGKKISFTYKFDSRHELCGTYYPASPNDMVTWGEIKYFKDGSDVYKSPVYYGAPYDHFHDVRSDGWITADIQYYGVPRVGLPSDPTTPYIDARMPIEAPLHQYQVPAFASVFIPGMSVTTLFRFFDLRFKYKCVYRSKTFDLE